MRNTTWLEAFAHELHAHGIDPVRRAELVVEAELHLAEAGGSALEHFGSPATYAHALLEALGRPARPTRSGPPVVEVVGVGRVRRGRAVLTDVSLRAAAGDIVALTGPNGSGKSTLLRIIAGLEAPDTGEVRRARDVGWAPQHGGLDPYLRPVEHVELFGVARGMSASAARAEGVRLAGELGWRMANAPVVGELSGGTRQKLTVVIAMLGEPELLLLDEPYQGMDAAGTQRFWELLWAWGERHHRCAIVASHAADALDRASAVVELGS